MVASADIFISTAQRFLCCGKKKRQIPHSSCLDIAVQLIAVDLGLKPAVLYDLNGAHADQIQRYVISLQEAGVLTTPLRIFSIYGSCLVVNSNLLKDHLNEVLNKNSILVDVCSWKEQPSLIAMDSSTKSMIKNMLDFFTDGEDHSASVSMVGEELSEKWNLCTLFGILLGYPASYWFDQEQSFENCLSMTPLVVTKVWVCWSVGDIKHSSCLYSFSVPEVLWAEVDTCIKNWVECLKSRFHKQTVLTELSISKETVVLPTVAL